MKNSVSLIGRVGNDPEFKSTSNNSVCSLYLATTEKFKDRNGEKVEKTEWHNLVFWGKLSEIVDKYVKKGDLISVDGSIKYESYEGNDGVKKFVTKINCNNMVMLGSNSNQTEKQNPSHTPKQEYSGAVEESDIGDLPF